MTGSPTPGTVDLAAEPPDQLLLNLGIGPDHWQRWLPWRLQDGLLEVVTCVQPGPELVTEVLDRFGRHEVRFVRVSEADLLECVQRELAPRLAHDAAERFAADNPAFSAKRGLLPWQQVAPALLLLVILAAAAVSWFTDLVVLLVTANVVFGINAGFKVVSTFFRPWVSWRHRRLQRAEQTDLAERGVDPADLLARASELPVYTILMPVYQEANVIGRIIENLQSLQYPPDKLDILVLLEENDTETIAAARATNPPPHVRLVVVPDGQPRTKPRACNYGLLLARGEYVVIYDAEDRPDPDQLLKVLASFRYDADVQSRDPRPLACVQAALMYYNADYNVLTRMFAIEYAHWFDSMLPGMDQVDVPIPLGGTSNHFLRRALVEVGGWDPYNVTEDADLGLRLAASGYRVDVVKSTTWEEATAKVGPWIRQRTRWIKGYMVTAAVNLRRPVRWLRANGWRGAITMFGLILGTPVAFLMYPLALGFTLGSWLLGPVFQLDLPDWVVTFGLVNMLVFTTLMVVVTGIAAWRRYNWRIAVFAVFNPVYWLLHAFAAWRAALQVGRAPHVWEKTPHGLTEEYDDSTLDTHGLPHSASTAAAAPGIGRGPAQDQGILTARRDAGTAKG